MAKKLFSVLAIMLALLVPAMAAPVGAAQLKGTYSFQVAGITTTNKNVPVEKITVGTISFNGAGKATFLSVSQYNQQSGGGPVKGTVAIYKVAGNVGTLTIAGAKGGTVSLSLGSYNAAGIATVIQLFIPDTQPSLGTAVLQ